jgi:hypothetical protein
VQQEPHQQAGGGGDDHRAGHAAGEQPKRHAGHLGHGGRRLAGSRRAAVMEPVGLGALMRRMLD